MIIIIIIMIIIIIIVTIRDSGGSGGDIIAKNLRHNVINFAGAGGSGGSGGNIIAKNFRHNVVNCASAGGSGGGGRGSGRESWRCHGVKEVVKKVKRKNLRQTRYFRRGFSFCVLEKNTRFYTFCKKKYFSITIFRFF
jgi:hypothetical protein